MVHVTLHLNVYVVKISAICFISKQSVLFLHTSWQKYLLHKIILCCRASKSSVKTSLFLKLLDNLHLKRNKELHHFIYLQYLVCLSEVTGSIPHTFLMSTQLSAYPGASPLPLCTVVLYHTLSQSLAALQT
jgi:hypothetical protein